MPQGSITSLAILRGHEITVLSDTSGDIDADREPAAGIYFHDSRYISAVDLTVGGEHLTLLDAQCDGEVMSAIMTNGHELPGGIPPQSLLMRRQRLVHDTVIETFSLSNYADRSVNTSVRLRLDADFEDIFVVRGHRRARPRADVQREYIHGCPQFSATGHDGVRRTVAVECHPASETRLPGGVEFPVTIAPQATAEMQVTYRIDQPSRNGVTFSSMRQAVLFEQSSWLDGMTTVETQDEVLNMALRRSLLDIHALQARLPEGRYVAAGVPWFDALFGRDALITGMEMVAFRPEILKEALLVLAAFQSRSHEPSRDAEPGKVPHEVRHSELANIGEVPFGRYYGSVDATPLFLMAAAEYHRWTHDRETIDALRPAVAAAVGWCRRRCAADPGGFLTYERESATGLEHQGWKDSPDGIVHPDGLPVGPPVALIEAQGYVAAAYAAAAELCDESGAEEAARLRTEAADVCARLEAAFGHPGLGYVLCLADGEGVPTPASNAGHLLWAGAASPRRSAEVGRRLLQPDLFTGWGIATLSATAANYNPLGYHRGTVWPHDNALILAGFRRYNLQTESQVLGQALLETAIAFGGGQIPELFSGDARSLRNVPTPFPVASRPQAWAAASLPFNLTTLLGLRPHPDGICIAAPMLPPPLEWVRVRNLRCRGASVDLTFRRHRDRVSVEVDNLRGAGNVVLVSQWPEPPIGAPAVPI